jgi:hypothetical protein
MHRQLHDIVEHSGVCLLHDGFDFYHRALFELNGCADGLACQH